MKTRGIALGFFVGVIAFIITSCEEAITPVGKGDVVFEITGAPADEANVQAVFITVSDILINGQSLPGFVKQTIDVKALQEGKTKSLGIASLDAKNYSDLKLILDTEFDAFGNAPGCYVLDAGENKSSLDEAGIISEIKINSKWRVATGVKSRIVIDVDLGKAIKANEDAAPLSYSFVTLANLQNAIRVMNIETTGAIEGKFIEPINSGTTKVFAYAYKKGTFDLQQETTPVGVDELIFKNAVTRTEVKSNPTGDGYKLAYLNEGQYEFYFARYSMEPDGNGYSFTDVLQTEINLNNQTGKVIMITEGCKLFISTSVKD